MSQHKADFQMHRDDRERVTLILSGDWQQGQLPKGLSPLDPDVLADSAAELSVNGAGVTDWDSVLPATLLQWHNLCLRKNIRFKTVGMPDGVDKLLRLATTVKTHEPAQESEFSLLESLNPLQLLKSARDSLAESLEFIGEVSVALTRLVRGKANTRWVDFWSFCFQAGPDAFAIISLTSVLVGMILAYLGAVQLQQFGAEIYVADLVAIGTLREMGALMTAIVMAGRTGAAYAAQLGTMQTNEEIDAISTMGISPIEFLVIPRMLALIAIMPLLTIYADILGIFGGSIVASGMGISPTQYFNESQTAITFVHISVGLIKSVVFAVLIAVAGCRAGINSGRSSAAVGEAATKAVVTAIVYLIVADASINIIFQQLDM